MTRTRGNVGALGRVLVVALSMIAGACGGSSGNKVDAGAGADAPPMIDGGGTIDAGSTAPLGHRGIGNVAGGVTATSANFKLVGTSQRGGGTAASPSFTFHSGVVGATQ